MATREQVATTADRSVELPQLLWIDCLSGREEPGLRERFETYFRVVDVESAERLEQQIPRAAPAALCFDYDYPLESQLGVMQAVKRTHSSLPILMLTVEHSEALAVWAFRVRIWNYLVKPVAEQELRANLQVLSRVALMAPRQRREVRLPGPAVATFGTTSRTAHAYHAVKPALDHIERGFREHISAVEMATLCGMSPFRFSREFHQAMGRTFQDHVLRLRISEACRLMKSSRQMPIAEICSAVGFNDTSYFARIFKRYLKMRPSEFLNGQAEAVELLGSSPLRNRDLNPPAQLHG